MVGQAELCYYMDTLSGIALIRKSAGQYTAMIAVNTMKNVQQLTRERIESRLR